MSAPVIANMEKMLGGPRDGALLRYSLGNEYLRLGDPARAAEWLRTALERNPAHSATWKLLGKALAAADRADEALAAWEQGIVVATQQGDVQAAKEMSVFAKRLRKA